MSSAQNRNTDRKRDAVFHPEFLEDYDFGLKQIARLRYAQ